MARRGLIGAAVGVAAAATGAVLVADRRIHATRRVGIAAQRDFAEPPAERAGFLRADDGVQLYWQETGSGDADVTVVLVHGFCLNQDDFVFQRRALRSHYGDRVRVLSYDHRSHGRSGRASSDSATVDQLGADLFRVLEQRVPAGRVVLVGHSMGGMTIMALADAHPELFGASGRVAGVALLSTSTGKLAGVTLGLPSALSRVSAPAVSLALRGARREAGIVERGRARVTDVAWVFVRRLAFGPSVEPGLVEYVTRLIGATPVDVIADFYPTLMSHDKLAALHVLDATPVLVVCGDHDLLTPLEHSKAITDALPKATYLEVPNAGHQALMERPDLVNPALFALIDEVLERSPVARRRRTRR